MGVSGMVLTIPLEHFNSALLLVLVVFNLQSIGHYLIFGAALAGLVIIDRRRTP